MTILFWLFVCVDVAALGLMFVLGLAAAAPSHTSGFAVASYMLVVPGLLIAAAILLFARASSPLLRGAALLLAASPVLVIVALRGIEGAKLSVNSDPQGNLTYFREGPLRDIATAISRNDAGAVTALVPKVDVNSKGYRDSTLLLLALRQLRTTPDQIEVLRTLVKAGANPNLGADELPLELALQVSSKTGPEPALLLLGAGANPNARNQFGTPVFFAAIGRMMGINLLKALLDRGAEVNAKDRQGQTALFHAATSPNWKAALMLLERGADPKQVRSLSGLPFQEMVESHNVKFGDDGGLVEVLKYLKR
jgi:ankyrin repeat protein